MGTLSAVGVGEIIQDESGPRTAGMVSVVPGEAKKY